MPSSAPAEVEKAAAESCVVLGGGGHAKVLIDCIRAQGDVRVYGVLDANADRWGQLVLGAPILGGDDLLPAIKACGIRHFAVGVGDLFLRERLFEACLESGLEPLTAIHPSALCSAWAKVHRGAQLFPGCIVNAAAVIGENVIVNSGAIVEHDCVVEAHAHLATGAELAGGVYVGKRTLVGVGACVIQNVRVGSSAVVGAGAVVLHDVPDDVTVVGIPARAIRRRDSQGG
jgi:sugar O-acyltransferase (sialic acid O-acetyltransferase NeuD family)